MQWRWYVMNEAVLGMLKVVFPYLKTKKRQSALAFKFREVMKQTFGSPRDLRYKIREEWRIKINSLNFPNHWKPRVEVGAVETVREGSGSPSVSQSELHGDMQEPATTLVQ